MTTRIVTFVCIILAILGCDTKTDKQNQTLYYGGAILTMEGNKPEYAESVIEQDGKIVFVGSKTEALKNYKDATPIDLQGKTLLPAFLDGHGHFYNVGFTAMCANLLPPPDGPGADYTSIIDAMNQYKILKTENT